MKREYTKWTDNKDTFIIKNYRVMSQQEIANNLNVTRNRITKRFYHLRETGKIPKHAKCINSICKPQKWKEEELNLLKRMLKDNVKMSEIYDAFSDRTEQSVLSKVKRIRAEIRNISENHVIDSRDVDTMDVQTDTPTDSENYECTLDPNGDTHVYSIKPVYPEIIEKSDEGELSKVEENSKNWFKFGLLNRILKLFSPIGEMDVKSNFKLGKKSSVWKTPIEEL